ncbi:hypothetical protein [Dawidia soli]|uniref:Uncharacterized protein n=1 Tax=Dawidia soli TaxID=2782352 RepID=A0AAP2GLS6_9BACT|nr:hypothetical protein [Dawidia soli]MBT1690473.1 hypothetical protein [Dawidia soli]
MKKIYLLFLLAAVLSGHTVVGQVKREQRFPVDLPAHDLSPVPDYSISARIIGHQAYEYTLQKDGDPEIKKVFTIRPNNLESFKSQFASAFDEVMKMEKAKDSTQDLTKYTRHIGNVRPESIFIYFQGGEITLESFDFRPLAGELFFRSKVHPTQYFVTRAVINARLKSAIRKDRQDQKQVPGSLKDLIGLRERLIQLQADIQTRKLAIGMAVYPQKVQAEIDKITTLLNELTVQNYESKRKEIDAAWSSTGPQLIKEISELIYNSGDDVTISVDQERGGWFRRRRYTVKSGTSIVGGLRRRPAKRALRRALVQKESAQGTNELTINNVEIEFNEGFIENIKVMAGEGDSLQFQNNFAIGFASKKDYHYLQYAKLFADRNQITYSIPLTDVIDRYEQKHAVGRRDYSPANQVITMDFKTDPKRSITLNKETTSKLFELKTFSDFVGFDQESPNGLIQLELEKRLNIRTGRIRVPHSTRTNLGLFQFITPFVMKSKIEENNKHLLLDYRDQFTNNQYNPVKFTSTLELKRFENFSAGADVNIAMLDIPSSKSMLYLNFGFRYGRVAIRDSLQEFSDNQVARTGFAKDFGVNTFSFMPVKICWELMTDERYTYSLGGSVNLYYLRDNYFTQVANIETYKDEVGKKGDTRYFYKSFFMQVCFRPQTEASGRLFFRYQYNWQQGYWRTGFHQAQVGYSVYLTRQLKQEQ